MPLRVQAHIDDVCLDVLAYSAAWHDAIFVHALTQPSQGFKT